MLWAFPLFTLMVSCDRPECKNANPVFNQHAPETKVYKDELAKQLKIVDNSKLSYWMGIYQKTDGKEYIHANIQGDGLCAVLVLSIRESQNGIEGILRTKGMGYRGAELKHLRFDVLQDKSNTEFIFKSIESIID